MIIANSSSAKLLINEVMQSNVTLEYDDLHDYPDSWIELYNSGNESVSLQDYSIGISDKASKAYQLPDVTVAPGGFILVYADKVGEGLHASFRIDSGKDSPVYLFKNGNIEDQLIIEKKMPAPDVAYGRTSDGADSWGYQLTPTPGKANCGKVCTNKDILPEPVFSISGGLLESSQSLSISIPEDAPDGTIIRYSLDCSNVTAESPAFNGTPIEISANTIVRARLFHPDFLSPFTTTHSFIFHPRQLKLPMVSIVADESDLFETNKGILTKPFCYEDLRRPANIEYFEPSDKHKHSCINQLCEMRTGGGWSSRNRPLKTLMVYANKRFGTKRLEHEFFPQQKPGLTDFKSIMLRNSGNDYRETYMRDAVIHSSFGPYANIDWQADQPAVLYINGVYKGLIHVRERSNEDHTYTNHGIEDLDVIDFGGENSIADEGDLTEFLKFLDFYTPENTTRSLEDWQQHMGVEQFANLFWINMFVNNLDFPGNNFRIYRQQTDDALWYPILKDTDWGLGLKDVLWAKPYNYETVAWMHDPDFDLEPPANTWGNTERATRIYRRMVETPEILDLYTNMTLVYLGDFMQPKYIAGIIDNYVELFRSEWDAHCTASQNEQTMESFTENVAYLKDWVDKRVPFFYTHFSQFYGKGAPADCAISNPDIDNCTFTLNGFKLAKPDFNGKWFAGWPINLSASCSDRCEVLRWNITATSLSGEKTTTTIEGPTMSMTMPADKSVEITPEIKLAGLETISDNYSGATSMADGIYDLYGRRIIDRDKCAPGIYITVRHGQAAKTVIR